VGRFWSQTKEKSLTQHFGHLSKFVILSKLPQSNTLSASHGILQVSVCTRENNITKANLGRMVVPTNAPVPMATQDFTNVKLCK
jgi:hypothetical protein